MNKRLLLGALFFVMSFSALAQQKITDGTLPGNNLPNKDALLELESSNKGLLHARVALTATSNATPLIEHVAGMMVYNTATAGDVTPGIYYNDGTKWVSVKTSVTSIVESQPGKTGEPGKPGEAGGPGEGVVIVNNDGGTWVYNPTTESWTLVEEGGNVSYDGDSFTYVDGDNVVRNITFEELVQASETITTIVANADGTYTYINENADEFIIDVPASVVNQFENIYNQIVTEEITVNGDTYNTFEEYLESIVTSLSANIEGSPFINVTGTGTVADPYVVSIQEGVANSMLITNAAGDLEWATIESIVNSNIDAKGITTDGIIKVNGADELLESVLLDADLSVADGSITTDKITPGDNDQVMITDDNGDVVWVDQSTVGEIVDATNGLNKDGLDIKLGGTLIEPTTITTDATNTLAVAGLQTPQTDHQLVVAEVDGTLRQVKAAMPKFFYMPAVIFDTSTPATGLTRNLHSEYEAQFTGTSNPTLVSSPGANSNGIPTLPANELEYHITYYDTDVFANLSIDDAGVLTYDIIGNATEASYMNIVFVVKD